MTDKDAQIKQYAIALKVANEEAEGMRKQIDNLKKIAVKEQKENAKLRGQIMKLERIVIKFHQVWTENRKEAVA
tara:strand:+ start:51 stop:272 length:222 start_codon:yes stop_codon:yes gene_type:complete